MTQVSKAEDTGCFFYCSHPKSSKCLRMAKSLRKKGKLKLKLYLLLLDCSTFTFFVGILPSLNTFLVGPVKKSTLYKHLLPARLWERNGLNNRTTTVLITGDAAFPVPKSATRHLTSVDSRPYDSGMLHTSWGKKVSIGIFAWLLTHPKKWQTHLTKIHVWLLSIQSSNDFVTRAHLKTTDLYVCERNWAQIGFKVENSKLDYLRHNHALHVW